MAKTGPGGPVLAGKIGLLDQILCDTATITAITAIPSVVGVVLGVVATVRVKLAVSPPEEQVYTPLSPGWGSVKISTLPLTVAPGGSAPFVPRNHCTGLLGAPPPAKEQVRVNSSPAVTSSTGPEMFSLARVVNVTVGLGSESPLSFLVRT